MNSSSENWKQSFFNPLATYRGEFSPEQLAFNANLQEFAQRVSLVCGLETAGKVSAQEAYDQIKVLWDDLQSSKKTLLDQAHRRDAED